MRKDLVVILALSAFFAFFITFSGTTDALAAEPGDPYYCPPGAKFCPAPGSDNVTFLDTHFGVDARTGQMTAYTGTQHPTEVRDRIQTNETVVYTAPQISVENRFVPPEQVAQRRNVQPQPVYIAPAQPVAYQPQTIQPQPYQSYQTQHAQIQPVAYQAPVQAAAYEQQYQSGTELAYNTGPARSGTASEVANIQAARLDNSEREPLRGERVPWWKGGLWRNRGNNNDNDRDRGSSSNSRSDSNSASGSRAGSSRNNRSGGSASRDSGPAPLSAADDMWGDDEYTGYGPDGSFSGYNNQPAQAAAPAYNDPFAQQGRTSSLDADPYAQPFQQQPDPYAQPYASAPSPYGQPASDPYSQPYSDPYAQQQPYAQPYSDPYAQQPAAAPYAQPYADPYASGPQYATTQQSGGFVGDVYTMPGDGSTTTTTTYGSYSNEFPAPPPGTIATGQDYVPPLDFSGSAPSQPQNYTSQPQMYVSQPDSAFLPPPSAPGASAYQPVAAALNQGSPQFEQAVTMVKESRFTEAKQILSRESIENPQNAAAWRWLADCHYNLLELDDAITAYERAISLDPNDYYAIRGQGFSYLHRGHELWRQMQEEVTRGQKDRAANTFALAHENYKKSLDLLGACLRRAPNDGEAIFGEAMAAEGASRKLYSNAISYLKLGPEHRERAELFAENCLTVINKGIERATDRAKQNPGEAGPRALLGGLFLRKALLLPQLGKNDLALIEL
ncbi:MAG: tetratricopeptide repeat protein, partial [Planctomycetes bacterium]|nr:tetratricopeptide repeat protein [Planctomycetota bacterium]